MSSTFNFSSYVNAFLAGNPGASIAEVYSPTPLLPGATLNIYSKRQPVTADTALASENVLLLSYPFPLDTESVIVPSWPGSVGSGGFGEKPVDVGSMSGTDLANGPAGGGVIYVLDQLPMVIAQASGLGAFARCYQQTATAPTIANANCESATTPSIYGTAASPVQCTFAQSAAQKHGGSNSFLFTKTGNNTQEAYAPLDAGDASNGFFNGLVPGNTYTFGAWIYMAAGSGQALANAVIEIVYDVAGTATTVSAFPPNNFGVWQYVTVTAAIPWNADQAFLRVESPAAAPTGTAFYVDDLTLVGVPVVLFDCSVDDASGSNYAGTADLVLSSNPMIAGQAVSIVSGRPDRFYSVPYLGNSVMVRTN